MAVDPYAPCPCGSGKKLKFCCSDLVAEIEKIHHMITGDQSHAALRHVEHLLEKQPERLSLLELRATLELSLQEYDAAKQTIDQLMSRHGDNPSPHAQLAILTRATAGGVAAIGPLQDALERSGDALPRRVFEALGMVGHALLVDGNLIAARGHLLLCAGMAPEGDNLALELLLRINLQSELPLLIRDHQILADTPAEVAWRAAMDEARRLATRGLWRRAEHALVALLAETGPEPSVVYNLALVRGWLGNTEEFAAGLHEYAQLAVPLDNAVEAEALAQLVDPMLEEPLIDSVRMAFAVEDADALIEKLSADRHLEPYEMPPEAGDEEVTPPRCSYLLLDRPLPSTGVGLAREEVPHIVGVVAVYGSRTDRQAQLAITTDRGKRLEKALATLGEIAGDLFDDNFPGQAVEEDVIAQKAMGEAALSWRWRLPNDTPADHRWQLLLEQRREATLNRWTNAPRAALGGDSPQKASQNEKMRIPLLACVLLIDQAITDPDEYSLADDLRQQLQLPASQTIAADDLNVDMIPIVRVPRLDMASLPDDQLAQLLDRTVMVGATLATLKVAAEMAERETLAEGIDKASAYRQLIRLSPDPRKALEWAERARAWSQQNNFSAAEWAVQELELHIELGDSDAVLQVLDEIRKNHMEEPGVSKAVFQMLQSHGLIQPPAAEGAEQGGMPLPPGAMPPAPAASAQELWTPDGNATKAAEPGAAAGQQKPAIWTPS